ncbi:hypothetical protein [Solirubrobacter soli]|uniref:hypothetical protein n=1 Tax=Solirubrobacter soli TaxID=363832 RepID=UPI00040B358B|nr:hypothetical protein [Solirubrobacter soli]
MLSRIEQEIPREPGVSLTLTGPAGIVLERAIARLNPALNDAAEGPSWARIAAVDLTAPMDWIVTAADCQAVERFSFDDDADPIAPW